MMDESPDTPSPEIAALERDIRQTRSSLARKVNEIERRLQPDEVRAELKDALRRRLDPEPYLGWIAALLIAVGGLMAWRGWQQSRHAL
jgi:hypothetical protein